MSIWEIFGQTPATKVNLAYFKLLAVFFDDLHVQLVVCFALNLI